MAHVPVRPRPPYRRFATGPAAAVAVLGLAVLALAHGVGQYTAAGRAFDLAAEGALLDPSVRARLGLIRLLGLVTIPSLATVLGLFVAVAAVRRRWWTALAVAVLVGGATVSSQILKYEVLERPDIPVGSSNSLPSGHSTIACAVSLAALLLVPARWRAPAAGAAALLGTGGGLTTLWAGTHRPVDVVAAVGVSALWTAVAVLLARRDDLAADPADSAADPPGPDAAYGGLASAPWLPVLGSAGVGAAVPVGLGVARLAAGRPPGSFEGTLLALVIGALVAATVALTVRALEPAAAPVLEPRPARAPDLGP